MTFDDGCKYVRRNIGGNKGQVLFVIPFYDQREGEPPLDDNFFRTFTDFNTQIKQNKTAIVIMQSLMYLKAGKSSCSSCSGSSLEFIARWIFITGMTIKETPFHSKVQRQKVNFWLKYFAKIFIHFPLKAISKLKYINYVYIFYNLCSKNLAKTRKCQYEKVN